MLQIQIVYSHHRWKQMSMHMFYLLVMLLRYNKAPPVFHEIRTDPTTNKFSHISLQRYEINITWPPQSLWPDHQASYPNGGAASYPNGVAAFSHIFGSSIPPSYSSLPLFCPFLLFLFLFHRWYSGPTESLPSVSGGFLRTLPEQWFHQHYDSSDNLCCSLPKTKKRKMKKLSVC